MLDGRKTIANVGDDYTGTIDDSYSMRWIALPMSDKPYKITLENRSAGGAFRGSVVANTPSGLEVMPFSAVAGPGQSVVIDDYLPPVDAAAIAAIITNQAYDPQNPTFCAVRHYKLSTEATQATPTPTPLPAACSLSSSTVSGAAAAEPPLFASIYGMTVLTGTENGAIAAIDPHVSINKQGLVAFVGDKGPGKALFVAARLLWAGRRIERSVGRQHGTGAGRQCADQRPEHDRSAGHPAGRSQPSDQSAVVAAGEGRTELHADCLRPIIQRRRRFRQGLCLSHRQQQKRSRL